MRNFSGDEYRYPLTRGAQVEKDPDAPKLETILVQSVESTHARPIKGQHNNSFWHNLTRQAIFIDGMRFIEANALNQFTVPKYVFLR